MPLNPLSPECCHCHTSSVHFLSFFFCFFFNLYSITLSRSLSTQGDGRHSRKGFFLLSSDHLQSPPIIPFFFLFESMFFQPFFFHAAVKFIFFLLQWSFPPFLGLLPSFSSPSLSSITSRLS